MQPMCPKYSCCNRCGHHELLWVTSRFVICNLKGSTEFERSAGLESLKKFKSLQCFEANLQSQFKVIENWFQVDLHSKVLIFIGLGHNFGGILGSWGTTLAPLW